MSVESWLFKKAEQYAERTYLVDSSRSVTYSENLKQVQKLQIQLQSLPKGRHVVFFGTGSIESYQLYFAVISSQLIWVPVSYRLENNVVGPILDELNPVLIVYTKEAEELIKKLPEHFHTQRCHLNNFFNGQGLKFENNEKNSSRSNSDNSNPIISGYLTSGSTGLPKVVLHSWIATLQHADGTVRRYELTSNSRLFNPRQLFHVSGAFALTTVMHCGGSIVIPDSDSFSKEPKQCQMDWAILMFKTSVTHASFLPTEMYTYADIIEKNPHLNPPTLQRITTGGEAVELPDLIRTSRAFAQNRYVFDCLWMMYPYLGDGTVFFIAKSIYEFNYGRMVQVTQSYGATELICNAVANSPVSGPDTRGIGTAVHTIHPEIIDEQGMVLRNNGKDIGRLRFFGSSIANGYLECNNNIANSVSTSSVSNTANTTTTSTTTLSQYFYQTNDLASIGSKGEIAFFGRSENLISLPGEKDKINPILLERSLIKITGIKSAIVFEYQNKLHVALTLSPNTNQETVFNAVKNEKTYALIKTVSLWNQFPVAQGGKVDKKSLITQIKNGQHEIIDLDKFKFTDQSSFGIPRVSNNLCTLV